MTISEALRDAAARLDAVSGTARLDAEILMAHALGLSRSEMLMRQRELAVPDGFAGLVERRAVAEPVAYIRGTQEFWSLEFAVTADVLIPRGDSETLIETAVDALVGQPPPKKVLDLGTGSGALLLAALSVFPEAQGIGVDASLPALGVAESNAERLGFSDRTLFRQLDWRDDEWAGGLGKFDLILCNPPYVETDAELEATVADHEPHRALFAGADGLDDYRVLIPQIPTLLAPQGMAIFEIGFTQSEAVSDLATKAGLSTEIRRDLAGNPRALRFSLGIGGNGG